jgi:hypothetical protein
VVAVAGAHPQPCVGALEHGERLGLQHLARPRERDPRLGQERRHGRGRDRGHLVAERGVRQVPDVGRQPGVRREPARGVAGRAARREAAHDAQARGPGLDAHVEHTEPVIRHVPAPDVVQGAGERIVHAPSASPGTAAVPRASRTARSTATGTTRAASASTWSGEAGGTSAVVTANVTSPSNSPVRRDASRQRVARRVREAGERGAVQVGVGRDDGEGGVLPGPRAERRRSRGQTADRVRKPALGGPRARQHRARRVPHVSHRVGHHQRADDDDALLCGPRPHAALHRPLDAEDLADGGAGPDAHRPSATSRPRPAGEVALFGTGPPAWPGSRSKMTAADDRDGEPARTRKPRALAQPSHHAVRGAEAERGAAGQEDGVGATDQMAGVERVQLAGPGGTAAHGRRGPQPVRGPEHHGAARGAGRIGPVPHGQSGDGGQGGRHRGEDSAACSG